MGGGAAVFAFFWSGCSSLTPCFAADGRTGGAVAGEATSIEAKEWDEDGRLDKPLLGYHAHKSIHYNATHFYMRWVCHTMHMTENHISKRLLRLQFSWQWLRRHCKDCNVLTHRRLGHSGEVRQGMGMSSTTCSFIDSSHGKVS